MKNLAWPERLRNRIINENKSRAIKPEFFFFLEHDFTAIEQRICEYFYKGVTVDSFQRK